MSEHALIFVENVYYSLVSVLFMEHKLGIRWYIFKPILVLQSLTEYDDIKMATLFRP